MATRKMRLGRVGAGLVVVGLLSFAGSCGSNDSADTKDRRAIQDAADHFGKVQPLPVFDKSQFRQSLIEVETMLANATPTYSYDIPVGSGDGHPVFSCSSIGMPIPSDSQLSNPTRKVTGADVTVDQMESYGVFTSKNTTGTHIICTLPDGSAYDYYSEGHVRTSTVPLVWDTATKTLTVAPGATSTHKFSTGK